MFVYLSKYMLSHKYIITLSLWVHFQNPSINFIFFRTEINETGRNITVLQALQYITESWEMTLMITCVLLLILTLMISMCVLLMKMSRHQDKIKEDKWWLLSCLKMLQCRMVVYEAHYLKIISKIALSNSQAFVLFKGIQNWRVSIKISGLS